MESQHPYQVKTELAREAVRWEGKNSSGCYTAHTLGCEWFHLMLEYVSTRMITLYLSQKSVLMGSDSLE